MRRSRSIVPPAAALALASFTPAAHAQSAWRTDGVLWAPSLSVDPDALPHVEGTELPGRWNWNAGIGVQYLDRPYAIATTAADGSRQLSTLVTGQLWTNYIVQIGVCPCSALAIELPVMAFQSADFTQIGGANTGSIGFGDVRFIGRWSTRHHRSTPSPNAEGAPANRSPNDTFVNEGPGLGVVLSVSAPTGDPHALTGAGAWIVHPSLVGDFRLFGLLAAAQVGYQFRFDDHWAAQSGTCTTDGTDTSMPTLSCFGDVPLRDAITYSAGLRIPSGLLKGIASPYVEAFGAFDARNPGARGTSPLELGGGLQRTFGELTATLGASTGLTDAPGGPRVRGMFMVQWAPRFIDEDGDGLRDNTGEDQCVGLPEDRDGYQDNDGCPEDNDTDDIPDNEDRCPMVNEDVDGFQDDDGCPDPDNDQDGVPDTQDQCPNVAMGPNPDEHRTGCPSDDTDHDGVPNAQDQCPTQPAGLTPDAARPGCPAPDRDHDGVPDPVDACPDEAAPAGASAAQQGCPNLDADHDGVLDAQDRCPGEPETINGFEDTDGCPEAHPPANARPLVRIVRPTPEDVGSPELLAPVQFNAHDEIAPASRPVLDQLAIALVATSRRPRRFHTVTVATTAPSVHGAAAVDVARAARRRDAVLAYLHAHGAPEWAVRAADPAAPLAHGHGAPRDMGIVIANIEHVPTGGASAAPTAVPMPSGAPASSSPPPSAAPSAASNAASVASPSPAPARASEPPH